MSKRRILIQIDPDKQASVFDSVVAIDCGVDHLFRHHSVTAEEIQGLVHGAMFTRGPTDLKSTAIFLGGSNVELTEQLAEQVKKTFFGPVRVSYMSDPNGSNTTAAASVLCALRHLDRPKVVTILGGSGPVGSRIARLIHPFADEVRVCSRSHERAESICRHLCETTGAENWVPTQTADEADVQIALHGAEVVFAAGAAGVELAPEGWMEKHSSVRVAIDVNAVPPAGLAGIDVMDKAQKRGDVIVYGAIGVGGYKMKIHKRCIESLFEANDRILETQEIFEVGKTLFQ